MCRKISPLKALQECKQSLMIAVFVAAAAGVIYTFFRVSALLQHTKQLKV